MTFALLLDLLIVVVVMLAFIGPRAFAWFIVSAFGLLFCVIGIFAEELESACARILKKLES